MAELIFVLVEPRTPENVGAAARALKTMGFTQLRLVNPCEYQTGAAQWLAHGSHDILAGASVFSSLAAATVDCDLKVGTTAKLRHQRYTVLTPTQLRENLHDKQDTVQRVALVFGREDTGLSNDETDLCELLSTVPLAQAQPSINLAQAVMIYAYELSLNAAVSRYTPPTVVGEWATLRQRVEACLAAQQIDDEKILQWIDERLPLLASRDIRLLHRLLKLMQPR